MPASRSYLRCSVESRLDTARNIVTAWGENADFESGMAKAGAKDTHIAALSAAIAPAAAADDAQAALYRVERTAAAVLKTKMAAAEKAYAVVYDRDEAAGRMDPELAAALDFSPAERNRSKRLAQMAQALARAEVHAAALGEYGLEPTHISAARTARNDAFTASQTWERRRIEAEDGTHAVAAAMKPMDKIVRDLQERGKIAFEDQPQLLEILGLGPIA